MLNCLEKKDTKTKICFGRKFTTLHQKVMKILYICLKVFKKTQWGRIALIHFNWMWVEITLTAQLKKIHTWKFIINTWLLLLSEFWRLAFNIIFLNALFQLFCTLNKKIDKILRLLGARISSLLKVLLDVLHMRAIRSCYSMTQHTKNNSLSSLIASNSFFLSNWLSFLRQKLVGQCMYFNSKYL